MLQTGSADAPGWPGWPGARVLVVLDDLYRLNAIAFWYSPTGRVAAGSYPPAAPTDPGVPHSGTRLLR